MQDVVSIRGRTYYPPEIEAMVERQLARAIKPGCSAAFVCEVRMSRRLSINHWPPELNRASCFLV